MKKGRQLLKFILCVYCMSHVLSATIVAFGADEDVGSVVSEESKKAETPEQIIEMISREESVALENNDFASILLNQYNAGGTIILNQDVTASGQCQLTGELDIDLNGYTMTMANGANFMLNGDKASLNIRDSRGGGILYASCQLVWCYSGGTFNLYGGILDGSKVLSKPQDGGCVNLQRSNMGINAFNMYGGTIRGFEASRYGGAVYVASTFSGKKPVFNMYGGTIENCYAPAGAAVYIDDSGDGPGYFYIKGGTKQEEGGEAVAVIKCDSYNGNAVANAIFNYGYLGMEGIVDIDGIVYLNQNNWDSTVTHFIKITGRLVVVGDGYIDIDSAYPNTNAICTGHTVVENVTQTVGGTEDVISQEEFYTYGSYFINSTKGLMISAGFDPTKQNISNGAPANWPTYQADKYNQKYTYVDVMGQTLLIQSSSSPGDKRPMQNYNYLIYTERAEPSEDYKEFYSIKISKQDIDGNGPLDGAKFSLKKKMTDSVGNVTYESVGASSSTGEIISGETYIYLPSMDGKLMISDGTYVLVEEEAPQEYIARGELATIEIRHKLDESSGQSVSVVEVMANNKVLTAEEQVINSTYGDKGWLVKKELVLYLNNSKEVIEENIDYKIRIEKYQDETYTTPLANAYFVLNTDTEPVITVANGETDANGILELRDMNGSVFTFSNGDSCKLMEESPPEDYYTMEDEIVLTVNSDNELIINGTIIANGETVAMTKGSAVHGSWEAALDGDILIFKIYDEPMPPTWSLEARKYGTQINEALALAGARFTLYKLEIVNGQQVETEVATVISSDGTDGSPKGTLKFVNEQGALLEFDCNASYLLREIQAPMGYEVMEDIIFQINEDGSDIRILQNNVDYPNASYDADNRKVTLSVIDKAVYHMPEAAGEGIYPVVVTGIMLMCIHGTGFIWFYSKKSTNSRN